MDPVEAYLRELRDIRSTGAAVPETSYYGCLERLLNERTGTDSELRVFSCGSCQNGIHPHSLATNKWLSYREHKILGRPLRADEARYVTEMARRIAGILLLQPVLDENYRNVKAHSA